MDMRKARACGGTSVPAFGHKISEDLRAFLWDLRS